MAYRIEWTELAWRDLEEAADYIAMDSPHYAAAFTTEVKAAAISLAFMPYRTRQVPEMEDTEVRELLAGNYRLIFQIEEDKIFILRLIHQAREYK